MLEAHLPEQPGVAGVGAQQAGEQGRGREVDQAALPLQHGPLLHVQLEEGPQLLTNIVDCDPDTVTIGMPVKVDFVPTPSKNGDVLGVPRFVPA